MEERLHRLLLRQELRKKSDHTTRALLLFFLVMILLGTGLLSLPAASRSGEGCGFFTALFTAASAVCVTGLSLADTYVQWSTFGQVVLLLLIQIGGLGYMTIVSLLFFLFRRRLGLRDRLILQQSLAVNELHGVVKLLELVVLGTVIFEGLGAAVLTLRFLRLLPPGEAVFYGVFHAVSAFCNAGFDLMGRFSPGSGMTLFAGDAAVNLTLDALAILGGLGFFVWNDLLIHRFRWRPLAVHTKLVLTVSGTLLLAGWGLLLGLEWANPATLGPMPLGEKLLAALFQSVNTRSAGFYTVPQAGLGDSAKLLSMLLMMVGGSSGSTTGGIKTVTVALVFLMAVQILRNRRELVVFGRKISQDQVNSAGAMCFLVAALAVIGGVILSQANGLPLMDGLYESVGAICTAGLSTGVTAGLNLGSKILLLVYMFFGRVGIMTISFAFMTGSPPDNAIGRPETRVLIG